MLFPILLFPIPALLALAGFNMVLVLFWYRSSKLLVPVFCFVFFRHYPKVWPLLCSSLLSFWKVSFLKVSCGSRYFIFVLISQGSSSHGYLASALLILLPLPPTLLCVFCQEYTTVISLWKILTPKQHKQQMPLSLISWFSCSLAASSVVMLYWHVLVVLPEVRLLSVVIISTWICVFLSTDTVTTIISGV